MANIHFDEAKKTVTVETAAGVFTVEVETPEEAAVNSIYVSFKPNGSEERFDIFGLRNLDDTEKLHTLLFSDPADEDPEFDIYIPMHEFLEATEEA